MRINRKDLARFFSKIQVSSKNFYKEIPCWEWTAYVDNNGYSRFAVAGSAEKGHRVVYQWFVADIPRGHEVDHLCRVRHCVNPCHLEAVPKCVNVQRGNAPTVKAHREGVCLRGHQMTPENTYTSTKRTTGKTNYTCKTCHKANLARRKDKIREQRACYRQTDKHREWLARTRQERIEYSKKRYWILKEKLGKAPW